MNLIAIVCLIHMEKQRLLIGGLAVGYISVLLAYQSFDSISTALQHFSLVLFQWLYRVEIISIPPLGTINKTFSHSLINIENLQLMETKHSVGKRIAIVVPFIRQDLSRLIGENINHWTNDSCDPNRNYGRFIDLVLYFNQDMTTLPELPLMIQAIKNRLPSSCFNKLRLLDANLTAEEGTTIIHYTHFSLCIRSISNWAFEHVFQII